MQYRLVYITTKDENEARKIGKALVDEKLAACVNIHPIKSIYRWEGEVQVEDEAAVLVKTRAELVDRVIERVKALHSYEVPGIVSFSIDKGNPDFLKWIGESTR
jgi:periplasmic divalent cation tolerance protein